ncbi:hypothetical protein ACOY5P_04715 [Enterobacter asburiae]|uniref:hypothetical protein n=1 Tax=Enterobacter asburiae TaxID=61645 RepID=UPI003BC92143
MRYRYQWRCGFAFHLALIGYFKIAPPPFMVALPEFLLCIVIVNWVSATTIC